MNYLLFFKQDINSAFFNKVKTELVQLRGLDAFLYSKYAKQANDEVNRLLKQFSETRKMMKMVSQGKNVQRMMSGMQQQGRKF